MVALQREAKEELAPEYSKAGLQGMCNGDVAVDKKVTVSSKLETKWGVRDLTDSYLPFLRIASSRAQKTSWDGRGSSLV